MPEAAVSTRSRSRVKACFLSPRWTLLRALSKCPPSADPDSGWPRSGRVPNNAGRRRSGPTGVQARGTGDRRWQVRGAKRSAGRSAGPVATPKRGTGTEWTDRLR